MRDAEEKARASVELFNASTEIGQLVRVPRGDGKKLLTVTVSHAYQTAEVTTRAVVAVKWMTEPIPLDLVEVVLLASETPTAKGPAV